MSAVVAPKTAVNETPVVTKDKVLCPGCTSEMDANCVYSWTGMKCDAQDVAHKTCFACLCRHRDECKTCDYKGN